MGLKDGENLNVTCPCCQAKLVIDPIFGAVLSHTAPVKPGPDVDLTKASSILEEQKKQREDDGDIGDQTEDTAILVIGTHVISLNFPKSCNA